MKIDYNKIKNDSILKYNLFPDVNGVEMAVREAEETGKFMIGILKSVDEFIKKNPSTKEITSPMFFSRPGLPDPDGLLSNEIFGLSKNERSGIYGYISLHSTFLHPLCYKKLTRLNTKFRDIVHGTKKFIITDNGELVVSDTGKTGIDWLKKNFQYIKLEKEDMSNKRENLINFIKDNEKTMWTDKLLVMPAHYRDVESKESGKVAVGEINNLYSSLIISCRGIKETSDYGFDTSDSIKGRIQETILAIYDCIIGNNNDMTDGGTGLSKKLGKWKRSGEAKTTNYGSRLVLSAPNMAVENIDDVMVDIKHAAVPLASLCANVFPYVINWCRSFFDNEFGTGNMIDVVKKDGKVVQARCKDPAIQFSDDVIKEEIDRFIEGWGNRLRPLYVQTEEFKDPLIYRFRGEEKVGNKSESGTMSIVNRRMTWCDIFFIAVSEIVQDKTIFITRYPMDSCYNQFATFINVKSTINTIPVMYRNKFYRWYPDIKDEDIGKDTSNMFSDTLWISNLMLKAIGGDYDGDTTSQKVTFRADANEEVANFINSKANVIGFNGKCIRATTNEAIQVLYNLSRILPSMKITPESDIELK